MTNPTNPYIPSIQPWPSSYAPGWSPPSSQGQYDQGPVAVPPAPQAQPMSTNTQFTGEQPSYYFSEPQYREYFRTARKSRILQNVQAGLNPSWTFEMEMALVNQCHTEWFGEPFEFGAPWTTGTRLDLTKLQTVRLRRKPLPVFKINYQSFPEIKLRLLGTVIAIKGHPFVVTKVKQIGDDFYLQVTGADEQPFVVLFSELDDLRSFPAMYITAKTTGWLSRTPGRVYQQGLTRQNTVIFSVDGTQLLQNIDPTRLVKDLAKRTNKTWNETLYSLTKSGELRSLRLTDDIAVLCKPEEEAILACYRGRVLGTIEEDAILPDDPDDCYQQWIETAVKDAGLHLN